MATTTRILKVDAKDAQKQVQELIKNVNELDKNLNNVGKVSVDGIDDLANAVDNVRRGVSSLNGDLKTTTLTIDQIAPNIAKIGAGVSGGFAIISGAMSMMGNESDEAAQAISSLQFYLQQLPIQFFAIAEGINATSSILGPLATRLKSVFKGVSEYGSGLAKSIDENKVKIGELINQYLERRRAISLFSKDAKKNMQDIINFIGDNKVLNDFFNGLFNFFETTPDEFVKLQDSFIKVWQGMEVQAKGTNDAFAKLLSMFKSLNGEQQRAVISLIKNIPIMKDELTQATNAAKNLDDIFKQLAEVKQEKKLLALAKDTESFTSKLKTALAGIIPLLGTGLVVAATAAGLAIKAYNDHIKALNKNSEDLYNRIKDIQDINTRGLKNTADEIVNIKVLLAIAKDEKYTLEQRKNAVNELNKIIPGYNAKLTKEGELYEGNRKKLEGYIKELKRLAVAKAAIDTITEKYKKVIEKTTELNLAEKIKEQVDAANEEYRNAVETAQQSAGYMRTGILVIDQEVKDRTSKVLTEHNKEVAKSVDRLKQEIQQELDDIEFIFEKFDLYALTEPETTGEKERERFFDDLFEYADQWYYKVTSAKKAIDELMRPDTKLGDLPYWYKVMREAANQIEVLNDTMQRFGESSLGLTGQYSNVVSDFAKMFEGMTEIIVKNGEVGAQKWVSMMSSGLQAVGSLMNALGDEQDTNTKKGFEAQKKYQISATVMNMLSGIMGAWASAMTLPPPANVALGAANAAMIGSLGAVQIAKIANQKFGGTSSSAVNSTIIPPVNYSSLVQGASTETAIKDTRSYVSVVEINKKQKSVSVSEEEAKY